MIKEASDFITKAENERQESDSRSDSSQPKSIVKQNSRLKSIAQLFILRIFRVSTTIAVIGITIVITVSTFISTKPKRGKHKWDGAIQEYVGQGHKVDAQALI